MEKLTKGHKDTKGKLKLNLVPPRAYESIALVREFGCEKYEDEWGWLECVPEKDFREAAKRHLQKIDKGELYDKESGLLHLEHACTDLAMAIEIIKIQEESKPTSMYTKVFDYIKQIIKRKG